MATLTPQSFSTYVSGDIVWTITDEDASGNKCAQAIEKGVVVTVDVVFSSAPMTVSYNIRLVGESGTRKVDQTKVFGSDTDALTAYTPLIA